MAVREPETPSTPDVNPDAAPEPGVQSMLDLFEESVNAHPRRALFLTKLGGRWQEVTYGETQSRIERVRRSLSRLGVGPGDRVGIISNNCVEWAVIAYAAFGLSAAIVPMYVSQPEREWEFIARDAGLTLLFVADEGVRA